MRAKGVGHSPTFHKLLQQASADCHCMLAGESMISSNMTISAFYRTQKLRFNVPQTYLCLILHAFWSLSLLINGFDQHSPIISFLKANLIFKYFICFCIWRILSLPSPSQFINLAMAKTRFVFLALLQIQVLNKNLTDNPGEDNNSLQYESRCSNIQIIMMQA